MDLTSIPEIQVETVGDEVTYRLPVRPLGRARWMGMLPLGVTLWLERLLFETFYEWTSTSSFRKSDWMLPGMVLLALIPFVVALLPAIFGLVYSFGRCTVIWRNGRIRVSDDFGIIHWRRRLPAGDIRKFSVFAPEDGEGQPITTGPFANLGNLVARYRDGKRCGVASDYPIDWLDALAEDLSQRVQSSLAGVPQVEIIDPRAMPVELADLAEQPHKSRIVIKRQGAGITMEIPPAGFGNERSAWLKVACTWCSVSLVLTSIPVSMLIKKTGEMEWPIWGVTAFLWLMGFAILWQAMGMAKRRATLKAGPDGVEVEERWVLGKKRREFKRGQIAAIRADTSEMQAGWRNYFEIQIHRVKGGKAAVLLGRDQIELRWIATELRNAVGVPARVSESSSLVAGR